MDYITYAVPFFLLALLIELIYGIAINKNTYRLNDAISNLFMGTLRTANKLIIIGAAGYVFYLAETNFAIWRMDINSRIYVHPPNSKISFCQIENISCCTNNN